MPIDSSEVRSTSVFLCDHEQTTENKLFYWHG